ncbi:peptidase M18, partial [Pavlovales sp. CCMP2436]
FLTAAVTPYHAVAVGSALLEKAGYVQLDDASTWASAIKPGGRYFYTRCDSTLVAFAVGGKYAAGGPFRMVGAHTDSPALKAKPLTKFGSGPTEGVLTQLSISTYGGGLWHTWFDRDLGIGGLVILRKPDGSLEKRLVAIREPVLRVPTLCIHLQSAAERDSFAPNKETHLVPVLCMAPGPATATSKDKEDEAAASADPFASAQEPELWNLLAQRLGVEPGHIASHDLTLFDAQPPALTGARSEFVCGGRLDNLASSFVALEALADCSADAQLAESEAICCVALFDHEEVGA